MTGTPPLRMLLLALVAPAKVADPAALAALTSDDWTAMLAMARAHRIDPLLHAAFRASGVPAGVPAHFVESCAALYRQRSMRALMARRELLLVARDLAGAGIEFIAMKGSYLAFHAYAEAGMRPLRDIDILVARGDALAAYHALVARGLVPATQGGDPARHLALKHQLPTLISGSTGIAVEVHHRAFHGHGNQPDLADDPGFAGRVIVRDCGGQRLRYMGAEDLLLHLIVHSVYDHRFDNGPGILADVAALLGTHAIDWPLFWDIAARQRRVRGAVLALRMADDHWGPLAIDWRTHAADARAIPDALLRDAAQLSLRDPATSADLALAGAAHGGRTRLLAKLFPAPALLRGAYPNHGKRRELPALYLMKWRDIALVRLPAITRSLTRAGAGDDIAALTRMGGWLEDKR